MRTLILSLCFVSLCWSADLTVDSPHQTATIVVVEATSPVTVTFNLQHEYVAFWMSDSTSKVESGQSCVFQAPPGIHDIRIVGSDWVSGVFRPVSQKKFQIKIVESIANETAAIDCPPVRAIVNYEDVFRLIPKK